MQRQQRRIWHEHRHFPQQRYIFASFTSTRLCAATHRSVSLELGAREVIGDSAGVYKNAQLVHKSFSAVKGNLSDSQTFHTDLGGAFGNALIDKLLENLQISHSLSTKGCSYGNAGAESTFRIIKADSKKTYTT